MPQLSKMDRKVKSSRTRALLNRHLASLGVPKSAHCLALRLAEEFAVNAAARSPVPPPEHAPRLTDASRLHVALVTDNVLAAAVAVASAARSAADPARLVLHVLTDRKSYVPMHSWFALHPVPPAVVEVRGLHQLAWRDAGAVASVMRTVQEVRRSSLDWYHRRQCGGGSSAEERERRRVHDASSTRPSAFSLLNYLKIHLPEVISDGRIDAWHGHWPPPPPSCHGLTMCAAYVLALACSLEQLFPELGRVVLLDDDVVVREDLAGLWEQDLDGNVIGAVGAHEGGGVCVDKTLGDHLNFSDPDVSGSGTLHSSRCAWSWGVNVVDLDAWRRTNVTQTYQFWLQKASAPCTDSWKLQHAWPRCCRN